MVYWHTKLFFCRQPNLHPLAGLNQPGACAYSGLVPLWRWWLWEGSGVCLCSCLTGFVSPAFGFADSAQIKGVVFLPTCLQLQLPLASRVQMEYVGGLFTCAVHTVALLMLHVCIYCLLALRVTLLAVIMCAL